jgi:hypothetical protein
MMIKNCHFLQHIVSMNTDVAAEHSTLLLWEILVAFFNEFYYGKVHEKNVCNAEALTSVLVPQGKLLISCHDHFSFKSRLLLMLF